MRILLFLATALIASAQITQTERLKWATYATIGPPNLAGGAITSAFSTASNKPPEYGPHWGGYFKRQGLRLTGAATSNLMEAELGALWGEDPRYHPSGSGPVKARILHALKGTVMASNRQGNPMPAYARFAAIPVSNVISNSWRPDSQRTASETASRVAFGFLGRMISNNFSEFWPDISRKLLKRK